MPRPRLTQRYKAVARGALAKMGLSEYEISLYQTVLKLGTAEYSTLVSQSRIPYGRFYDVARKLAEKGFLQILPGRPKQFRANNPRQAVSSYLAKLEADGLSELGVEEPQSAPSGKELAFFVSLDPSQASAAWVVEGEDRIEASFAKIIEEARSQILCVSRDLNSTLYATVSIEELIAASKRGVGLRCVLSAQSSDINNWLNSRDPSGELYNELRRLSGLIKTRFTTRPSQEFMVVDAKTAIYHAIEAPAFYCVLSPTFSSLMTSYFEILWEQAGDLSIH